VASKKKRKITSKTVYDRYKRNLRKYSEYINARDELKDLKKQIADCNVELINLENEYIKLVNKEGNSLEELIEALPIESLKDLYGTSDKAKFKDVLIAGQLENKLNEILDKRNDLSEKLKLRKIDVLECKITILLYSSED